MTICTVGGQMMVLGRVEQGQIQLDSSLPEAWEGRTVKIEPCTSDDAAPDLTQRPAALHALGPMEYEAGEQQKIEQSLAALNELSRVEMQRHASNAR